MEGGKSPRRWERYHFRTRHHDPQHLLVTLAQLLEVQSQESGEAWIRSSAHVGASEMGHLAIVPFLAVGMQMIPALMSSQVAVELRADVIKLVKERHEFMVKVLIEKSRQTKRHEVKILMIVVEVTLDLKDRAAVLPLQVALLESKRRDTGLQAMESAGAGLREADQDLWDA